MAYPRFAAVLVVCFFAAGLAAKKKKPDDITQTLALPKDPPFAAVGDASRLVFNVSPLSPKGLLSQQTRDALKSILKANGGAPVVHLRAFVAGSGDLRRVPQIVSEVFTDKKMQLPSVSVIQAGALPLENAQIAIEAVSESKKQINPDGLTFVAAQVSLDKLASAVAVTCFVSDLASAPSLAARFPGAAVDIVQTQRIPERAMTRCEGVVRGGKTGRLAFTGTQIAFGSEEKDAKLAFQRLDRGLAEAGATPADIVATNIYPLSGTLGELARKLRPAAGAFSIIPFEGVASMEAGFAVDAVALTSR